jgi:hypothetical protein
VGYMALHYLLLFPYSEDGWWCVPKFFDRPTRGSNYVEMRKELELGAAPNFQH